MAITTYLSTIWLELDTYVKVSARAVGLTAEHNNHPAPPSWNITRDGKPASAQDVHAWLKSACLTLYGYPGEGATVVMVPQERPEGPDWIEHRPSVTASMDTADTSFQALKDATFTLQAEGGTYIVSVVDPGGSARPNNIVMQAARDKLEDTPPQYRHTDFTTRFQVAGKWYTIVVTWHPRKTEYPTGTGGGSGESEERVPRRPAYMGGK